MADAPKPPDRLASYVLGQMDVCGRYDDPSVRRILVEAITSARLQSAREMKDLILRRRYTIEPFDRGDPDPPHESGGLDLIIGEDPNGEWISARDVEILTLPGDDSA